MEDNSFLSQYSNRSTRPDIENYEPINAEPEDDRIIAARPVVYKDFDADAFPVDTESTQEAEIASVMPKMSYYNYSVFLLLGVVMLWAWNMFLAAAPFFQTRFADDQKIVDSFQAAITSVACVTNLVLMILLGYLQKKANYGRRITAAMVINLVVFSLLAISTKYFTGLSPSAYLAFTLVMVFTTSSATALIQNGAFAFAGSFGRTEYMQALMTGQAIAGVLPSLAQIAATLLVPQATDSADSKTVFSIQSKGNTNSAFWYFITATIVSVIGLLGFLPLARKHQRIMARTATASLTSSMASLEELERSKQTQVTYWSLYKKLPYQSTAVFLCFTVTMFFPVFTGKVVSVVPEDKAPRFLQKDAFIALGFFMWNLGDLAGRSLTAFPWFTFSKRPKTLLILACARVVFIPAYFLCNVGGNGAVIDSDYFYLFVVQFLYGGTGGWLSSLCMVAPNDYVEAHELPAANGFMAVNLVGGLTTGSLLSFSLNKFTGV